MLDFVIHVLGTRDRLADLGAQELPEALPEAVDRALDRALARAQLRGHLSGVRRSAGSLR